eukprot:3782089-Rhodomonas_salina.5
MSLQQHALAASGPETAKQVHRWAGNRHDVKDDADALALDHDLEARHTRGNQAAGPAPCRGRGPGTTMRQLSTAHLIAFELLRQRPDCTGRYPQAVAVPGFA